MSWFSNLLNKKVAGAPKFGTMSIHETDLELAQQMLGKPPSEDAIAILESAFKTYLKAVEAYAFGQEPLDIVLTILEEGAIVVAPAFMHRNTAQAFERKGLRMKWVDIELTSFGPNFEELKVAIEGGADALFLPHFLGIPSNQLDEIVALCVTHSVWLIEDCRHALGGLFDNNPLGSFGDLALFSFNAMMPINTIQGGLIAIKDNLDFADKIKSHQDNAIANPLSQKELIKLFIKFYEDRKIPDKGLLDIKKGNSYWEEKYTFTESSTAVKIHPAQAVLAKAQFDQAESFSYYRQNHLRLWQAVAKDHHWTLPTPVMRSAPGWLRAPVLVPPSDTSKAKSLEEHPEISHWYHSKMLPQGIDFTLFEHANRASKELFLFPTEL